ncbi:hypothetical protein DERP_010898, partial [Dermatophagoides pteronyssinus]
YFVSSSSSSLYHDCCSKANKQTYWET